jgi:DNA-3-methyladenine glycosylase II
MLVRSIVHQQISPVAGRSIDSRLRDLQGGRHEPSTILALGADAIRPAGLSASKARTIVEIAAHLVDGRLPLAHIGRFPDEKIIERLTAVRGIGRWTAEMFLVSALARPDVFSATDLGIRNGLRIHFGLEDRPSPADGLTLAEPWRPFRTVAMWYLWRRIDHEKQDRIGGT